MVNKLFTVGGYLATLRSKALYAVDPYNPLNLPPNTIRVRTNNGQQPFKGGLTTYETATLVQGTNDVYDVYKSGTSFYNVLWGSTNVVEVLGANTSNVTNMQGMFNLCSNLTTVPLFDTSSVTNMEDMFYSCSKLTTVPLYDTSNVTTMDSMFFYCIKLTTVPLFDTSNVTDMYGIFRNCNSLTTVPLFDTSSVTNMSSMFDMCGNLTTVPLFDTSNVYTMYNMLRGCQALTTVPLFDTSNVVDMNGMLYDCVNVESGALALYQQASTQTTIPDHVQAFYNCGSNTTTGAAELAQIPDDWK